MNSEGAFDVLPPAREDVARIALFLAARNPQNARSFLEATRETFDELANAPFLGSPQFFSMAIFHSLRRWPVRRFRSYQIYYRPFASANGVEIWRVLHSSQDVTPALHAATKTE